MNTKTRRGKEPKANVGKKRANLFNGPDSTLAERTCSSDEEKESIFVAEENAKQQIDAVNAHQQVKNEPQDRKLNTDTLQSRGEISPFENSVLISNEDLSACNNLLVKPDALQDMTSTVETGDALDMILCSKDNDLDMMPPPNNINKLSINAKSQRLSANHGKPNDRNLLKGSANVNNRSKLKSGKLPSHAKMDKLLCELKREPEQKLQAGIMLKHHNNTTRGHKMDFTSKVLEETRSHLFRQGVQGEEFMSHSPFA